MSKSSTEILRILLIEANITDASYIIGTLKECSFKSKITHVINLKSLRKNIKTFDVVLINLNVPESTGLDTLIHIQNELPNIPIVVLTGPEKIDLSIASIQAGAQDYLNKNDITASKLTRTIQYAIKRYQVMQSINQLSTKKQAYLATHEVTTGLLNQQAFLELLQATISRHTITKKIFGLIFIEVHGLDKLTSFYGYLIKNQAIKSIVNYLQEIQLEEEDSLASYQENIFAFLLSSVNQVDMIEEIVKLIRLHLSNPILIADNEYFPSYHIGVAIYPFDGTKADVLINKATQTTESTFEFGMKAYEGYSKNLMPENKQDHSKWERDIDQALKRNELFIVYQPQVCLKTERICGVEALLRWQHPKYGIVSPAKFIPIMEDSKIILPVGEWVLNEAIQQYRAWQDQIGKVLPIRITVNLSAHQLSDDQLVFKIQKLLNTHHILPDCLEIELTENIFISQPESVINKLNQLRRIGIQIAIDDFGRGYSSLSYLSHLPINRLKIDVDFIHNILTSEATQVVVQSIINLSHSLGLRVIAEGVETKDQYDLLRQQACDEIQGYYFSKPVAPQYIAEKIMSYG